MKGPRQWWWQHVSTGRGREGCEGELGVRSPTWSHRLTADIGWWHDGGGRKGRRDTETVDVTRAGSVYDSAGRWHGAHTFGRSRCEAFSIYVVT